ncbi:hypothetical protein, conserved [Eimeria praecox]|uniref:Rhodanese domain-containing protein n=1 Tax=Eimeria praecox TaxID=51316 RepID=U6H537_9EIME|nr:hypothetical protein, conserved [Eimeria praecox]
MPSTPVRLLLVLLLLHNELSRTGGFLRPTRSPSLLPQASPHERPSAQHRAFSSTTSANGNSSNSSTSGEAAGFECPRCVWLQASDESSPVVVGGERSIGVSVFQEDAYHTLPLDFAGAEGAESELSVAPVVATVAPATDASPFVIEVVPVEVGIAQETRRALGLFRGSQKRHIFLPLCLLGPFQDPRVKHVSKGAAAQAGTLQAQDTALPSRAAADSPPPSLLESLRKAVFKALKLKEDFCGGLPLQLVAQVSAPKTKCRSALQPDSPADSQLGRQLHTNGGLDSEGGPVPELLPLESEEEALRTLREHYGPLLTQYRCLPHCPSCVPPSNIASDRVRRQNGLKREATLRILRLPRGPKLSIHLQLEPPLPSVPFSTTAQDFASPPPLGASKIPAVRERITLTTASPYQMVSLYKFFPFRSPKALAELLRALWGPKGVLGRAYVAEEGLNAQLAVPSIAMSDLLGELQQIPGLEDGLQVTLDCLVTFEEYWRSPPFDALHIRPRHQVLRDGFAAPLDWANCGEEVSPSVWHHKLTDMLQQQQQKQYPVRKTVLLDMRNASEYAVGHFKGAKCIDTPTFAASFTPGGPLEEALLQAGVQLPSRNAGPSSSSSTGSGEDVEVLMYCTGGIRCVKAGAFLKQVLGFPRVTRLKGGILAYKNYIHSLKGSCHDSGCSSLAAEKTMLPTGVSREEGARCDTAAAASQPQTDADKAEPGKMDACTHSSLFLGSNYVFDHRMCQQITPDLLAQCIHCGGPSGRLSNCSNRQCGRRVVLCSSCCASLGVYCSPACAQHGAADSERDRHAQIQRRMQARHTHKRLLQQRGLWAIRAQQLLAALKHNAAFESPAGHLPSVEDSEAGKVLQQEGRAAAEETSPQDLWKWAHHVAAAATSPSVLQEALLEEGRNTAKSLVGAAKWVPQFWSGYLHSRILSAISRLKRPNSILEIGAFVGISSLALAEGLACRERVPGACVGLVAIEKDPRAAAAARRLISSSPWGHLITVVEADALQWLGAQPTAARSALSEQGASERTRLSDASLQNGMFPDGGFDLIYLDAEKKKYAEYVACILDPERPLLAPDGTLLIDNTLWGRGQDGKRISWWEDGATEDTPRSKRYAKIAESLKALRQALRKDRRISHVLLPVGDGLSIVTWATSAPYASP